MKKDCVFCNYDNKILENEAFFAIYDKYPVSKGHMLIIPKRHTESYFNLSSYELQYLQSMLEECKSVLRFKYNPDGFNIGINDGKVAGQTVMHLHIHIIPRYKGDMDNPEGGVRGVIPEKRTYKKQT
jgi:diadenosine tetraphosphate (Ap4A) HIT family hydrolase